MTDENGTVVTVVQEVPSLEMKASARAAMDVQANPNFLALMEEAAMLSNATAQVRAFSSDAEETWGNEVLVRIRTTQKALKVLKDGVLRFPKLYEKSCREAFRPVEDMLGVATTRIEEPILAWREQCRKVMNASAQAARTAYEAAAMTGEAGPIPGVMVVGAPPVTEAPIATKVVEGGKVGGRKIPRVKIVDIRAFLKAIISEGERNKHYTVELIIVNERAIIDLWKSNMKLRIPGIEIEVKEVLQVTTEAGVGEKK